MEVKTSRYRESFILVNQIVLGKDPKVKNVKASPRIFSSSSKRLLLPPAPENPSLLQILSGQYRLPWQLVLMVCYENLS